MAARTATKAGNWSDVSVWDGGASLPGAGDTADSNGYTVTINQDIDLAPGGALINTNAGAGNFAPGANITITADISSTVRQVLIGGGGYTVAIIGNISGSTLAVNRASGSGTFSITGNVSATGAATVVSNATSGIMHITGNVSAAAMTGTPYNGCVSNAVSGTLNVTGNVTGGNVTAAYGINNVGTGQVNVTGNVTGGTAAVACGIYNGSTGTVTVSGTATGGGDRAYGVDNVSTGTAACHTAVGGTHKDSAGLYGENSGGVTTFVIAQHSGTTSFPLKGFVKCAYSQTTSYVRVINATGGGNLDMSLDYPAEADVKTGTVYKLGTQTGGLSSGGGGPVVGSRIIRGLGAL